MTLVTYGFGETCWRCVGGAFDLHGTLPVQHRDEEGQLAGVDFYDPPSTVLLCGETSSLKPLAPDQRRSVARQLWPSHQGGRSGVPWRQHSNRRRGGRAWEVRRGGDSGRVEVGGVEGFEWFRLVTDGSGWFRYGAK